jgi:hypothetical protein
MHTLFRSVHLSGVSTRPPFLSANTSPTPLLCTGLRLINLMGSHGTKAIAAAVLGAQCTCVDISPVNASYCARVAAAAGVTVDFVVADVLDLPPEVSRGEEANCGGK